jgi:5-methylcytosine-specific restriction protein A
VPYAAPRICSRCRQLAPAGQRCDCRPAWEGTQQRGHGRKWSRYRLSQLKAHPICQHPGCRMLATEVDHRIPLAEGGARFDFTNMQSLCSEHHQQKSTADAQRGRTRRRGHDA